jgi:biotin operon repressor
MKDINSLENNGIQIHSTFAPFFKYREMESIFKPKFSVS